MEGMKIVCVLVVDHLGRAFLLCNVTILPGKIILESKRVSNILLLIIS